MALTAAARPPRETPGQAQNRAIDSGDELFESTASGTVAPGAIREVSWAPRLAAFVGLLAPVFAGLWLNSASAVAELEPRVASLTSERAQLAADLAKAQAESEKFGKELATLKRSAVISDEHALMEAAETAAHDEDWAGAEKMYREFLDHYPNSQMAKRARDGLALLLQRQVAEKLNGFSIAELFANMKSARGQTLVRSVSCQPIKELDASSAKYQSDCFVGREDVRVLYTNDHDIRPLAELPRVGVIDRFEYTALFRVEGREPYGNGVVFRYLGLAK
jgi:hypothetical protein